MLNDDLHVAPRQQPRLYNIHVMESRQGSIDRFVHPVQTPSSGISILLAVGTPSTSSGNLYSQWELSPGSGNALCILFPTILP
nr:hypothetical protein [Tanacetum cinerariifolium]